VPLGGGGRVVPDPHRGGSGGRYALAVARLLILGGGCRGLQLAESAVRDGYAVRVLTRTEDRRGRIEAVGAECRIGDPQRLGTLRGALDGVTVACWLLAAADGSAQELRDLHGARLRAFLEHAIDTTMRGFLYEVGGGACAPSAAVLKGEGIVRELCHRNSIPCAFLRADPTVVPEWVAQARAAIDSLLG
jgi:hypothetical protein